MKVISGYVDVPQADREAFAQALHEHSRLTNAEVGCHYFRVVAHKTIAGRYHVEEAFDDIEAYNAHMTRTRQTVWAKVTANISRHYTTS